MDRNQTQWQSEGYRCHICLHSWSPRCALILLVNQYKQKPFFFKLLRGTVFIAHHLEKTERKTLGKVTLAEACATVGALCQAAPKAESSAGSACSSLPGSAPTVCHRELDQPTPWLKLALSCHLSDFLLDDEVNIRGF